MTRPAIAAGLVLHWWSVSEPDPVFPEAVPEDELRAIRLHLQQQRAWGSDDFRAMVEAKTLRFAASVPPTARAENLGEKRQGPPSLRALCFISSQ
jgi:hypothetical protein